MSYKKKPSSAYQAFLLNSGLDYRYLYLMERVTNKSIRARATFQHEVKIGIAKNEVSRHKTVNKAIKGKVELVFKIRLLWSRRREKFLHNLFGASRFTMKGGRNGGLTEWFYLNWLEYALLIFWIYWFKIKFYVYFILAGAGATWYILKF